MAPRLYDDMSKEKVVDDVLETIIVSKFCFFVSVCISYWGLQLVYSYFVFNVFPIYTRLYCR